MATNLNIDDDVRQPHEGGNPEAMEETGEREAPRTDGDSGGYIAFLDEHEVLEAHARATRENPGALIWCEPHGSDLWSLQVYTSEAAKEAFRLHFFYHQLAIGSLSARQNGEQAVNG